MVDGIVYFEMMTIPLVEHTKKKKYFEKYLMGVFFFFFRPFSGSQW